MLERIKTKSPLLLALIELLMLGEQLVEAVKQGIRRGKPHADLIRKLFQHLHSVVEHIRTSLSK